MIVPVFVFAPDRAVSVFIISFHYFRSFCMYSFPSLKSIMNHHHAAFWSDPCSTSSSEEEIEESRYNYKTGGSNREC